jgi:hypothetical protein
LGDDLESRVTCMLSASEKKDLQVMCKNLNVSVSSFIRKLIKFALFLHFERR